MIELFGSPDAVSAALAKRLTADEDRAFIAAKLAGFAATHMTGARKAWVVRVRVYGAGTCRFTVELSLVDPAMLTSEYRHDTIGEA